MHANHCFHPLRIAAISLCVFLLPLTACATPASTRHVRVVNATYDDVTALATAPSGSTDFQPVTLPAPLRGGHGAVVVDVPADACRRDVRVTFQGGRSWLYPSLDVCRHDGFRLATGAQPARSTRLAAAIEAAGSP